MSPKRKQVRSKGRRGRKPKSNNSHRSGRTWVKIAQIFGYFFAGLVTLFMGLLLAVILGLTGPLPGQSEFQQLKTPTASLVLDRNGNRIGSFGEVDRIPTSFNEISPFVINALIATEDERFYEHKGVDSRSLLRVLLRTVLLQDRSGGGGSTISQQLVKNLYPRSNYSKLSIPINKMREMVIATRLENYLSKEKILELYLNTVPFGENTYGIASASRRFFNKKPSTLKLEEAAVLVGMLKANTTYNPRLAPDRSKERRNVVLKQMVKNEFISMEEYQKIAPLPIVLDYRKGSKEASFAYHFKEYIKPEVESILQDYNQKTNANLSLMSGGLTIYTTIDRDLQQNAEQSVRKVMADLQKSFNAQWNPNAHYKEHPDDWSKLVKQSSLYRELDLQGYSNNEIEKQMKEQDNYMRFSYQGVKEQRSSYAELLKYHASFLNAGSVAMDPYSGDILAWVGSIDPQFFPYDHVASKPGRQPGSTFKPFVYTTALEQGVSPCTYIKASQKEYEEDGDTYKPRNTGEQYEGKYSLEGALTNSVNTVAIKTINEVGIKNTIATSHRMGITSELPEVSSLALGTASVTLLEMVNAYCTYVNEGKSVEPRGILKIQGPNNELIYEAPKVTSLQAIAPKVARQMTHMLQNVVNEGTGRGLRYRYNLKNDIGGKTGTTQNNADGWFIGIMPRMVVGAWVGNDNPSIHFASTAEGQGARTALPVVGEFITSCNGDDKMNYWVGGSFRELTSADRRAMACDPFKEEFNLWQRLFKRNKEKKIKKTEIRKAKKKEKKGFFKRLFGKNKS